MEINEEFTTWAESINEGDMVKITHQINGERIARVIRVTRTQITLDGGIKFRKSDGRETGKVWGWPRVIAPIVQ